MVEKAYAIEIIGHAVAPDGTTFPVRIAIGVSHIHTPGNFRREIRVLATDNIIYVKNGQKNIMVEIHNGDDTALQRSKGIKGDVSPYLFEHIWDRL